MLCHFRVGSGGASSRGIITSSSRTTATRATSVPLVWGLVVHIFHIDIKVIDMYGYTISMLAECFICWWRGLNFFFFVFFLSELSFSVFVLFFFPYGMSFWIGWRFSFVRMVARECLRQMGSMCVKKDKKSKKRKREGERGGAEWRKKGRKRQRQLY